MLTSLLILSAVTLDYLWGEPRRFHPLVGFGHFASWIEKQVYRDSYFSGFVAFILTVIPLIACIAWLASLINNFALDIPVLYLVIGRRSLCEHARQIYTPLRNADLPSARQALSMIVSRDTGDLSPQQVSAAAVESVLENSNDALFAALFWYLVAGIPGAIAFRLINTLDAMWGYRNTRYNHFGWTAAKVDDVANLIPARLTALSLALCGHFKTAINCWRQQAKHWKSPNAGPVMSAGAGSLQLKLGGPAPYHGNMTFRPDLGEGKLPEPEDIMRATSLINKATLLWLALIILWQMI